jgi:hypothetical protein
MVLTTHRNATGLHQEGDRLALDAQVDAIRIARDFTSLSAIFSKL